MIFRYLLAIVLCLVMTQGSFAQGIDFFKGSFDEALSTAKKEGKLIFVDAYAVWCGPCKRMAKTVFPDEKVGQFYNKNFVNIKMDMEKGEGLTFRKKYPVSAFPTLFYIDDAGQVVQKVKGARQAEGFIGLGKQALQKADRSGAYLEEYEKGKRDPEFIYEYIRALNRAGKPSLKIANDYLKGQKDLTTPANLNILFEATTVADSRVYSLFIKNREAITELHGAAAVAERIELACQGTVKRAIEFQSEDLLEEAINKMERDYKTKGDSFAAKAQMDYYLAMRDADAYLDASKDYAKEVAKDNPEELYQLSAELTNHFRKNPSVMKEAEKFAGKAAKKGGDNYRYYLNYASILNMNGKKSQALKAAQKSKEFAKSEGPKAVRMVEVIIRSIQES
ncbi:MAG: thioredoxin domain-containing protein [Bacteroidota bacterium]